jgi:lipopolysaccharide biosynthesis glycosyltransferase
MNCCIFWTFDNIGIDQNNQQFEKSVRSFQSLNGIADLIVYSTNPDKLSRFEGVQYKKFEPVIDYEEHKDNCGYPINIGHARIFILPLLQKEYQTVLYVDGDVFVNDVRQVTELLLNNNIRDPMLCGISSFTIDSWCKMACGGAKLCQTQIDKKRILNNGIILVSSNHQEFTNVAQKMYIEYVRLANGIIHYGLDQLAVTMAFENMNYKASFGGMLESRGFTHEKGYKSYEPRASIN